MAHSADTETVAMPITTQHGSLQLDSYAAPQHLRAVAHLYGVSAPDLKNARVLVLGCESGMNLIPFSCAWSDASVIGIDIDADAISLGKSCISTAGISNLELYCLQLTEILASDPGEQDYIIVQGVFALLDNQTRESVLAYCRQHLSAKGIIAIKWPTYPGAKACETLRDAMLLHSSQATTEEQQTASARAMATYLELGMSKQNPLRSSFAPLIAEISKNNDSDLVLKYLSGLNEANYLVDFNAMAQRNGLAYLGDAKPWTEIADFYGPDVEQLHKAICPVANKVVQQQYLDFSTNRTGRFSLLVDESLASHILPLPDKQKLKELNWAGNFQRLFSDLNGVEKAHFTPQGDLIRTQDDLTLQVLDLLGDAWPLSLSFEQLVFHTSKPESVDARHSDQVLNVLYSLFCKGAESLLYCLGACPYSLCENNTLKQLPGLIGMNHPQIVAPLGFNFWYQAIALENHEYQHLAAGQLSINSETLPIMDALRRKGMVTGSPRAWQKYLQAVIGQQDPNNILAYVNSLMLFTHYGMEARFQITNTSLLKTVARQKHPSYSAFLSLDSRIEKRVTQLLNLGQFQNACDYLVTLSQEQGDNPHLWHRLAQVYFKLSLYDDALRAFAIAFSLESNHWALYYDYALLLGKMKYYWYAEKLTHYCLRFNQRQTLLWIQLCELYQEDRNFEMAEICARKALDIEPLNSNALSSIATLLTAQSKVVEAVSWMRKACESAPGEFTYFTNYLFGLSHYPDITPEYLFSEHEKFGRLASRWAKQKNVNFPHNNSRDPARQLRVGFVSGDFGNHPVTHFLRPMWEALDQTKFALYAWNTSPLNDLMTQQLKVKTTAWFDAKSISHVELAKQIHAAEIDILIDLSGHTDHNRLPAFALKPAPVSMSFIGYPGTTGLSEMDYVIVHNKLAPQGLLEKQFTEKLAYMPFSKQFEPVNNAPEVKDLPALSNGYITYGSFNRPGKINDVVLETWAKILTAQPDAKFLIGFMPGQNLINEIKTKMMVWGVRPEQLIFRERTHIAEYLEMHNEVDLLLDCFPYTGGTTTNHALWMGVPTLTFASETMVSRQGVANMCQYGLDEFVAESIEEYISKALALSHDVQVLSDLRRNMRERIVSKGESAVSPAWYLEQMLRKAWEIYCETGSSEGFVIPEV
ncbi:methyltransferase regulatory domain-containing protein [Buttiauxella sp. WJP83]|uniref:O-linked N-acetylglucosamine transferase family protein n=1 Tax=Buttiauxella sp. WJP83 TaxID=2986951 RepID=UPI0022DDA3C1|nr:methyltransferase regulatory domain-containing protein [Buttiauxella sp. WJP83]WBM72178.1 methyltransferase regulatory domain-containing protein [Buttiauxella sp. WJP83]